MSSQPVSKKNINLKLVSEKIIKFIKFLDIDLRDVHAYAGILLIAIGCYQVYPPAALIVPGGMLFYIALRSGEVS